MDFLSASHVIRWYSAELLSCTSRIICASLYGGMYTPPVRPPPRPSPPAARSRATFVGSSGMGLSRSRARVTLEPFCSGSRGCAGRGLAGRSSSGARASSSGMRRSVRSAPPFGLEPSSSAKCTLGRAAPSARARDFLRAPAAASGSLPERLPEPSLLDPDEDELPLLPLRPSFAPPAPPPSSSSSSRWLPRMAHAAARQPCLCRFVLWTRAPDFTTCKMEPGRGPETRH